MQYPFRFLCGLVVSLFVLQGTTTAQTQPPDAGILLQEQRQLAPRLPDRLPAPEKLEGLAQEALPEGSPARMESIERAVLLMNDLPGINAQAALEPGEQPGSTRIIIETVDSKAIRTGPWGNKVP